MAKSHTALTILLFVGYASAHPMVIGVNEYPEEEYGYSPYYANIRPGISAYYPAYANAYPAYANAQPAYPAYAYPREHYVQGNPSRFVVASNHVPRPVSVIRQQPVVSQTHIVQQQPSGTVQNQASSPTQIFKPAPPPPVVVNPSPVVVRPPPPPPIYVQPQKIFVQPPQVPPVFASNPEVYYSQGNQRAAAAVGDHVHQHTHTVQAG